MQSTSQQQPPIPCRCQQQLGEALPWLGIALIALVVLDRWSVRRHKRKEEGGKS